MISSISGGVGVGDGVKVEVAGGASVAIGVPGASVAGGVPGAGVAIGVPGASVAIGVPGASVAVGVPGASVAGAAHAVRNSVKANTPWTKCTLFTG